jgi:predicted DNA repair protein MutK
MSSSLLALLDDITTILDDVAVMTKVATKKTAGVLGDDLALNAQQVTGVKPERELPVVWAVAKGSFVNKAILVPAALAISAFEAWLRGRGLDLPIITSLMMIGGAFLCFEGVEKLAHKYLHSKAEDDAHHRELVQAVADEKVDLVAHEKSKIRGAIRTDFILSAEIIVITLGTAAGKDFSSQVGTLVAIAIIMTVGVYGLVAGIVKLDDAGLYLSERADAGRRAFGRAILWAAPWLMKFLSFFGTAAMFLVGGGILVHAVPVLHHFVEHLAGTGGLAWLVDMTANLLVGIAVGIVVLLAVTGIGKLRRKKPATA